MKNATILIVGLSSLLPLPALASDSTSVIHQVRTVEELVALAPLLADRSASAPESVTIQLAPGTYELRDSIRILRSHVVFAGQRGTRLVLAEGINEPVIAVGTQSEHPTADESISRIAIRELEIDGNRLAQSSETSFVRPWIRNNGIDVRAVTDLLVEHVAANNNRSGGLVISWECANVLVQDSVFSNNHFDGLAFYASTAVTVSRCMLTQNRAAGISLDNDFRDSVFTRCLITDNGDVGIFARHSRGIIFDECEITSSGNWAVFLGHDSHEQGVSRITITNCQVRGNDGGVFLASLTEKQSSAVRVRRTTFADNHRDGRANLFSCGTTLEVTDVVEVNGAADTKAAALPVGLQTL